MFLLRRFSVSDACRDFVEYLGFFKLLTVTNFTWTQIHLIMDLAIMQNCCKIQTVVAGEKAPDTFCWLIKHEAKGPKHF